MKALARHLALAASLAGLTSAVLAQPAPAASAPAAAASAAAPGASAPATAAATQAASATPAAKPPASRPRKASPQAAAPAPACIVAQFRGLVLATHEPVARSQLATQWMRQNLARCSKEQIAALRANLALWLGTSHTHELASMLDGAAEVMGTGNPALLGYLYDSLGRPGARAQDVYTTGPAPMPVVPPVIMGGGISGSANYGTISGPSFVNSNANVSGSTNTNLGQNSQAGAGQSATTQAGGSGNTAGSTNTGRP